MKELQPDILNDYEHLILRGIDHHCHEADFPTLEANNFERKDLEDYLYEYQRILDSPGTQKSQLTKYGIVAVIPILILSAFPEEMLPWGKFSLFAGLAIGIIIAAALKGFSMLMVNRHIKQLRNDNVKLAAYADKVKQYVEV